MATSGHTKLGGTSPKAGPTRLARANTDSPYCDGWLRYCVS
jgi:hypothetical protein